MIYAHLKRQEKTNIAQYKVRNECQMAAINSFDCLRLGEGNGAC